MSAPEWYFTRNNQQQGPVTLEGIRAMAAARQLQPTDLVWQQGMANWQPAGEVEGLFAAPAPPPYVPVPPPPAHGMTPTASQPAPQPTWQGPPLGGAAQNDPNARPYYGQPVAYGGYERTGESHKGTAVAAFVMSIIGLFICGLVLGIVAIVQSNNALRGMRASGNDDGKGLAIAARVIGIIALVGWAIGLFVRFAGNTWRY